MTHTVGAKGQVVIPKELRDRFGIEPGDEVSFWDCDDHVALRPVRSPETLMGRFGDSGMAEQLLAGRDADRRREDAACR
ncbi:MAG: AbrB/MazE/SpoVT family DNA-binding domain-containing protein [bacterium]|nr:AbrB/MazE/SpoVT family DNA-binding domain-containing protein [bacterium]